MCASQAYCLIRWNTYSRYLQDIPLSHLHVSVFGFADFVDFVGEGDVRGYACLDVAAALVLFGALLGGIRAPFRFDVEAAIVATPRLFCDAEHHVAVVVPEPCPAVVHALQVHGVLVVYEHLAAPPALHRCFGAEAEGQAGVGAFFDAQALGGFAAMHFLGDGFDVNRGAHGLCCGGLE